MTRCILDNNYYNFRRLCCIHPQGLYHDDGDSDSLETLMTGYQAPWNYITGGRNISKKLKNPDIWEIFRFPYFPLPIHKINKTLVLHTIVSFDMVAGRGNLGTPVLHLFMATSSAIMSLDNVLLFEPLVFELGLALPPPTSSPHFLFGFCFPKSVAGQPAEVSLVCFRSSSQRSSAPAQDILHSIVITFRNLSCLCAGNK